MVSSRRLLAIWGALHLSVGAGVMGITHALLERPGVVPLLVGAIGALMAAVVLLHRYPELEYSAIERFGFLTFVLSIVGHVVIVDGLQAPPGESSPLTIGLLWLASMAVASGLSTGAGYERVLKRIVYR